jgi:hypothetical protein
MLLVLIVVVSLNFFTRPSASAIAMFSSERVSSKCTFVSVLCSRKSWITKQYNISLASNNGISQKLQVKETKTVVEHAEALGYSIRMVENQQT